MKKRIAKQGAFSSNFFKKSYVDRERLQEKLKARNISLASSNLIETAVYTYMKDIIREICSVYHVNFFIKD